MAKAGRAAGAGIRAHSTIQDGTPSSMALSLNENAPLPASLSNEFRVQAEVPDAWPEGFAEILDRSIHAMAARLTAGLSPAALAGAYMDWAAHLAFSPGKQLELGVKALRKAVRLQAQIARETTTTGRCEACIAPLPQDKRFTAPEWCEFPYRLIYQSFLLQQQWWRNATTGVDGLPSSMRRWSTLRRGRFSTSSRRRISC